MSNHLQLELPLAMFIFLLSLFGIQVAKKFPVELTKKNHICQWRYFAIPIFAIIKESPQQQQTDLWSSFPNTVLVSNSDRLLSILEYKLLLYSCFLEIIIIKKIFCEYNM
jgi:hypothetical protein